MRETLYFKDDDTRLSFLQGNYVTLTNMKDKDIDRIISVSYTHLVIEDDEEFEAAAGLFEGEDYEVEY